MRSDFSQLFSEWEKNNPIINKDQGRQLSKKTNQVKKSKKQLPCLDLHGKTRKEALSLLNQFILTHQKSQVVKIKIIHGIGRHSAGNGILKEEVKKWLTFNTHVIRNFRPGQIGEGSAGVTIAYIKAR